VTGVIPPEAGARHDENRAETGPPGHLNDPLDMLGSANAPDVVMLNGPRLKVCDATFRKIGQTFFERFRNKSASTRDYIDVANEVSGRDYIDYIKSWISGATTPAHADQLELARSRTTGRCMPGLSWRWGVRRSPQAVVAPIAVHAPDIP